MNENRALAPIGVHHVTLVVEDVGKAVDFYTRMVGLRLRADRPADAGIGAWLDVGTQQIHLLQATPPPESGQHVALAVTDLDATMDALHAAGIPVSVPSESGRRAFLADPSGNAIELVEIA